MRSSGKVRRNFSLAVAIAQQVGMVPTWPNLQTIRLALEFESSDSEVSLAQAAALIVTAATEVSPLASYSCPSAWEIRQATRKNTIDRFWFEDARWRTKSSYWKLLDQTKAEAC